MPEGPEIHIAADEVGRAIAGRVATRVFFAFHHLKSYEQTLSGETITAVQARGKAILIRFANGLNIYSHNQLYGKWLVQDGEIHPDTNRQLRLAIYSPDKAALLYSASEIEVLRNEELDLHPYLSKLGPDVLDESVSPLQVIDRLLHKRFYRRRFGSLLLNQQFLAGLGNYLRSEILFAARLHPLARPVDCSQQELRSLAEALLELPRQSYQTHGVTNDLDLAGLMQQEGRHYNEYRFQVFDREDQPCYVCGTPIIKTEVGGRRLYYCPACQPEPL